MTSKYRVEYALKSHRRDQFIEWIKGLLAVPFVLLSQPAAAYDGDNESVSKAAEAAQVRLASIMRDVESLVKDHRRHDSASRVSKLKLLVPSIGKFFTELPLEDAFYFQDNRRRMSARRFVAPSFNDVRLTLNTAQLIGLVRNIGPKLITFDGDLTLYDDGQSLKPGDPIIYKILRLLVSGMYVAIVTAAGYTEAEGYYKRLGGLLNTMKEELLSWTPEIPRFAVLGGESQYLFVFDSQEQFLLRKVPRHEWELDVMKTWTDNDINTVLDAAEEALSECIKNLGMAATILRKERAVGIVQTSTESAHRLTREQLEETVLVTQQRIELANPKIPFCAFNGGADIFVDIGGKDLGVEVCKRYFGGIQADRTLHCGDQFLSMSQSNDFRARLVCTTAWVTSPLETIALLDELLEHQTTITNAMALPLSKSK